MKEPECIERRRRNYTSDSTWAMVGSHKIIFITRRGCTYKCLRVLRHCTNVLLVKQLFSFLGLETDSNMFKNHQCPISISKKSRIIFDWIIL